MKKNERQSSSYAKKTSGQVVVYLAVAVVLYGAYYYLASKTGSISREVSVTAQAGQKFSESELAPFGYQIYPGILSEKSRQAITGFNMETRIMDDGSAQVSLTATNSEHQDQKVVVMPGYTLYFIEKDPGDDSVVGDIDRNEADDFTVLVDPEGNIAQTRSF